MAFRVGADLVNQGSVPGDEWRIELTDNGNVLLGFNVQARGAALAIKKSLTGERILTVRAP